MSKTIRKFNKKEIHDRKFSDKPMPKLVKSTRKGRKKENINDMIEEIMNSGMIA